MPVVGVNRDRLFEALEKTFTDDTFQDLCFDYGIELDDVTSEKEIIRKEHNLNENEIESALQDVSEDIIYKIDIPANRYDMLCIEGISRALNIFRGQIKNIEYKLSDISKDNMKKMYVKEEVNVIRPYVVCAILRDIKFDTDRYNSFIDLQDKLHQNLCRHRTLVAIGTHDLDMIKGPFTYEAFSPNEIKFVPLKQTKEFDAGSLLNYYLDNDKKLSKYVPIIQDSPVYPVIYDANRIVLSLPPIINGAHSAISLNTKNVFIECTATCLTKAKIVLNTVCCMFSEYCSRPYEIEPVEVIYTKNNDNTNKTTESMILPDIKPRSIDIKLNYINKSIGVQLASETIYNYLEKMMLTPLKLNENECKVLIPATRSDILHACDIVEDVAIAHGYNNIIKTTPLSSTEGKEFPLNQMTELIRLECAMAGFTEILTWCLCSHNENFKYLQKEDNGMSAVCIGNPATAEFEVCRTSLLSGALKTLASNSDVSKPIKLFEISDIVILNNENEVGAENERHLVAVYCNKDSGFEIIHGLLNRLMDVLGVPLKGSNDPLIEKYNIEYEWKEEENKTFFPGRYASIYQSSSLVVGGFGVIHPKVLENFGIDYPVSALEMNLEPFCYDQFYNKLNTKFKF